VKVGKSVKAIGGIHGSINKSQSTGHRTREKYQQQKLHNNLYADVIRRFICYLHSQDYDLQSLTAQ
jgi:hypothetical protein